MKKVIAPLSIILLLALMLLLSCTSETDKENITTGVPVKTEQVIKKEISAPIHSSGKISSATESKLSFKIGGIVERIYVREGEYVQKGKLLAQLNQAEINAKVTQAENGYEKAQRDFDRVKALREDDVATLEQYQNAETGLNVARANLEIANFNQKHSKIYAPEKGKVLKQLYEENELVGSGYPVLLFGSQSSNWIVRVGLTDRDILRVGLNDLADVYIDAYPDKVFSAKVTEVGQAANPYNGTYEVELTIDSGEYKLISGFVARVDIFPAKKAEYSLVPIESIVEADELKGFVYSPLSSNKVSKIPVTFGPIFGSKVAILSGIDEVKEVITAGSEYLSEESIIRVVN